MSVPMPICSTMRFKAISPRPSLSRPRPTTREGDGVGHGLAMLKRPVEVGAGMRGVVNSKETLGLDRSIALGRRQARMTQQLLNCAQVAAGAEEMGCKAVPQGVRGRRFGEAEKTSQRGHLAL